MQIVCIRLNSGEEVIGRVAESLTTVNLNVSELPWEAKGRIVLETVRTIAAQPVGPNQMAIGFAPYAMGNTDAAQMFTLDNCASSVYPASDDIEKGYIQQTSALDLSASRRPGIQF